MEIPNYRPNSQKYKDEQAENEKKIEKAITGSVRTRKQPVGRKIADSFISEDAGSVKNYLLMDVLVPAIKDTLSDIIKSGIDMILFGESRASSGGRRIGSSNVVSYQSYYNKPQSRQTRNTQTVRLKGYEFEDIVLENRADAEEVLSRLIGLTREYGMASVTDLYELVGLDPSYMDNKYGWYDLKGAGIERVRDGFILALPRTTLLD